MNLKAFFIFSVLSVFILVPGVSAQDDEALREYPDGAYGLDLGGGYEVLPDGEFLAAPGYREEYRDTTYGPITQYGFAIFPDFSWKRKKPEVSEKAPMFYYIYDEYYEKKERSPISSAEVER